MTQKTYVFSVTLKGTGDNPDAAWQDAVEAFSTDSSVTPDAYEAGAAGVTPLHDPRLSHRPDALGVEYRASLPAWVDTRKCAFCHPDTGCLLPRESRAPICREWVCELWR